jgi:NAD(P)-dependent dehydrogenase (short-subunit alcohol dehydrogenase family)
VDFSEKVVVVTGAGGGIGRATAEAFAERGAKVAALDINLAGAQETVSSIGKNGGQARAFQADVAEEASVVAAFRGLAQEFGRVNVLVNVAGIELYKDFLEIESHEWDRQLAVNLKSVYLCARQAVPHMMKAGGGSIVNTASVQALATTGRIAAYAAAKAGILGMTRDLARDLGQYQIRVNSICPGCISTPMMDRTLQGMDDPKGFLNKLSSKIPLQRLGTSRDIANVAVFLSSSLASYLTGTAVIVDGGLMSKLPLPD